MKQKQKQAESGAVYLRTHDPKFKKPTLTEHQTWDRHLFITTKSHAEAKEGRVVEVITRDEYRAEVWPRKA